MMDDDEIGAIGGMSGNGNRAAVHHKFHIT
jgi:hypothetical protein